MLQAGGCTRGLPPAGIVLVTPMPMPMPVLVGQSLKFAGCKNQRWMLTGSVSFDLSNELKVVAQRDPAVDAAVQPRRGARNGGWFIRRTGHPPRQAIELVGASGGKTPRYVHLAAGQN